MGEDKRSKRGKIKKYNNGEGLKLLEELAMSGLTNDEIAIYIGIAKSTIATWVERDKNIRETIKRGREHSLRRVEDAMFKLAVGEFVITEDKVLMDEEKTINPDGSTVIKKTERVVKVEKQLPPNPAMIIFYLKNKSRGAYTNRDPEERDRIIADRKLTEAKLRVLEQAENAGDKSITIEIKDV